MHSVLPGMLVPRATNTMAVTASFTPTVAPKCEATSPMTAVTKPMPKIDTTKHRYPLNKSVTNQKRVINMYRHYQD